MGIDSKVLVMGANGDFVVVGGGVGWFVGVIDEIDTGNEIKAGRIGARIVDDNIYGRSVSRSISIS